MSQPSPLPPAGGSDRTLAGLAPGRSARVLSVGGSPELRGRLLEVGFVPRAPVRVVRLAPLGDPMEVFVNGSHLTIRRADAGAVRLDADA